MNQIRKNISNILGWSTKRRIVVFESDDWGSVRTRSKQDYDAMLMAGLDVDKNFFTKYDCLESNNDLERLFNVLSDFKDFTGRVPVFTPMCIVANPDFDKIAQSDFKEYHYKTLDHTLNDYPNHDRVLDLWKSGATSRLFVPALHGREHLNVRRFLKGLNDRHNPGLRISFNHNSIGVSSWKSKPIIEYLGAFYPESSLEIEDLQFILQDGINIFEKLCGYRPTQFIGPSKEPAKELDKTLAINGVKYLTQSKLRKFPRGGNKFSYEFNWVGKKNEFNQIYIMRNSGFEPTSKIPSVSYESCLNDIDIAFKWNKPAVISTHRVNYVGTISQNSADYGLQQLRKLLNEIIRKWPNVEFMTSSELGSFIESEL